MASTLSTQTDTRLKRWWPYLLVLIALVCAERTHGDQK